MYGKFRIRLRQVSSLRGDQKTKKGKQTDGGYARKDFYVETHLEAEKISESDVKKAVIDTVKPKLLKLLAGYKK